jgi:hypothetical protein
LQLNPVFGAAVSGVSVSRTDLPELDVIKADVQPENVTEVSGFNIIKRQQESDEWAYVIFNGQSNGQQCGGTEVTSTTGPGNLPCRSTISTTTCVDISVGANVGFASCNFKFSSNNSCGDTQKSVTVNRGQDSNGVSLSNSVHFVSVSCNL